MMLFHLAPSYSLLLKKDSVMDRRVIWGVAGCITFFRYELQVYQLR